MTVRSCAPVRQAWATAQCSAPKLPSEPLIPTTKRPTLVSFVTVPFPFPKAPLLGPDPWFPAKRPTA
ncbi:hypothetical protein GCM10009753_05410 [Streptantibioticus ferralitis]